MQLLSFLQLWWMNKKNNNKMYIWLLATLSEKKRARKKASFHNHMGVSNNAISRKPLIFLIWSIEQKIFIFEDLVDIRDEPARRGCNAF